MPRTAIYYLDYQTSLYRKRFMVYPAMENAAPGNPRIWTNTPAWGADPGDGVTNWIKLPAGILKEGSSGEAGYDELPIGCPDPPSRTFKLDLHHCIGNSDLEDFVAYLLTPVLLGEGSFTWAGNTITFDTLNVFVLVTDKGNAALSVGSFPTEYIGVQERKTEETMEIVELTNRESLTKTVVKMTYEASTVHLLLWACQSAKPSEIRDDMIASRGGDYTTHTTDGAYMVWEDSGRVFGLRYGSNIAFSGPYQYYVWFAYGDLWESIDGLLTSYINTLIGNGGATFTITIASGYTSGIGPLGVLNLYKRDLDVLTGVYTGTASESDAHFCGLVYLDTDPGFDGSGYVGGWLVDTFQNWETVWDYMKDAAEGFGARMVIQHTGSDAQVGQMTLLFEGMLDSQRTNSISLSTSQGTLSPVIRKGLIAGGECDIAKASSGDVETLKVQLWGTMDDPLRSVPSTHHSNVLIGDVHDVYFLRDSTGEAWNDTFSGSLVLLMGKVTLPDCMLVYLTTPSWATEQIAVPFHHYVGLRTSNSTTRADCMNALASNLPTPSVWTDPGTVLWDPLRLLLLDTHLEGGVPYAVTKGIAETFSKWNQIGLSLTVPSGVAVINDLGSVADIDLSTLAGGLFNIAARDPFINAINATEDTTEVTLLAPGS